ARILSALLGTLTPFCSCSSIPLFIGFTNANLPIGVTFAFLISSPLVDLGSLVLLMSIFGTRIALIYVIVGLILAVVCGSIIEYLNLDKYVIKYECNSLDIEELNNKDRIIYAKQQVIFTYKKVYKYILIGVGIGALIHNVIPTEFIMNTLGSNNPFNVILATIIGIPMYGDIFGTIPIAEALLIKGVGLGTILSFMMAVTALSLPSIIMLKEVIKPKLLGIFITIVTLGIIIVGYLFNIIA
ncbi:MAG: permease, partial [Erysipelotrichaceae bacterium]